MTAPSPNEHSGPDLYQVLGLHPGASTAEITRAYRRLARRHHPDVDTTSGAAQRFAEITRAYRVLSDPHARARYDAGRAVRRIPRPPNGPHHEAWSPWTTARFRPGRTPREAFWLGAPSVAQAFHLGTDFPTRPAAESEEAELELTLEESYHGTTRTVTVTSHDNTQTLHVVIPPGVIDGDRIEVPTQLPGGRATPAVFLRVRLAPPERYQLDGRDLHVPLPLSPWEAALGATIALDTPGRPANIEVPAGTCTGHVLTLPGLGIPNPTGPAGDLHAHVRIVLPARLTPAERDLFRRLAETSTFDPRTTAAPARNHADH